MQFGIEIEIELTAFGCTIFLFLEIIPWQPYLNGQWKRAPLCANEFMVYALGGLLWFNCICKCFGWGGDAVMIGWKFKSVSTGGLCEVFNWLVIKF